MLETEIVLHARGGETAIVIVRELIGSAAIAIIRFRADGGNRLRRIQTLWQRTGGTRPG
jgi:hypothetical protein